MERDKTIVVGAVAVTAVTLVACLAVLGIFFLGAPRIGTVITPLPPVTAVPKASPTPKTGRVEVTRVVTMHVEPSPTPAACTPLPNGMTFTVSPVSDNVISLELTGLQPDEELYLIFIQDKPDGQYQVEEWGMEPVGSDGRISFLADLNSPYGYPEWELKVIHARGAACLEITLPLGETAAPLDQSTIQTGGIILFARDNDLWRADANWQNEQRLTEDKLLAGWQLDELGAADPWWAGGFPPQIHISPDGRWLAFTQTVGTIMHGILTLDLCPVVQLPAEYW